MNIEMAREKMVEQQVRAWDVLEAEVLDVLRKIPREEFVPQEFVSLAFADTEIPIGHGESMMTPTVEGRVLQSLRLDGSEHVLEIGTGTGFLSACLASLGHHVTSVDIHDDFLKRAAANLDDAGFGNVNLKQMDAMQELPPGKFDAIAVTGSLETFDTRFVDALRVGGRLFIVVGDGSAMDARLATRTGESDWDSESLFETCLKPLVNGRRPPQFRF